MGDNVFKDFVRQNYLRKLTNINKLCVICGNIGILKNYNELLINKLQKAPFFIILFITTLNFH